MQVLGRAVTMPESCCRPETTRVTEMKPVLIPVTTEAGVSKVGQPIRAPLIAEPRRYIADARIAAALVSRNGHVQIRR